VRVNVQREQPEGISTARKAGVVERPTMKTLAEHVGVSRQLVSLVLRDLPGASEETRAKVLAAAKEIGYYPDASARALRGRRTFRLGVLFTMHQPFEVDLVEALFGSAEKHGFSLILGPLSKERSASKVVAELLGQRIEALFVLAAEGGGSHVSDLPANIPVIMVGGPRSVESHDDLRVDDAAGTRMLVEHLIGLGHTRIAYVSGGEGPGSAVRRSAYEQAMAGAGLEHHMDVVGGDYSEEGGSRAAIEILNRKPLPTAIMAANDRSAMGVLGTLVRHGLRVPEDISVVGFDDSTLSSLPYVQLTTVGFKPRNLTDRATAAMVRRLEDPSAPWLEHKETPHLVVRTSSGPPRERDL
jgi:DNA-binding LacI/PurR family transcriptional regulator